VDEWTLLGDQCLPASDFLSIVPFRVESPSGKEMGFHLCVLIRDHSLQTCTTDNLGFRTSFQPMAYPSKKRTPVEAPEWQHVTYYHKMLVGHDVQITWNINPNNDDVL